MDKELYDEFEKVPDYFGCNARRCRYCMMKYDGTIDYYLDPNDPYLKEDGTPSDYGNPAYEGNLMMEISDTTIKEKK